MSLLFLPVTKQEAFFIIFSKKKFRKKEELK
jgi:hypothetical protein